MAKEKTVMITLSSIKNVFDVRTKLDEDRVLQFMGMYESGEDVPPLVIVRQGEDSYAYIDGRHRGAALEYLNRTEAACILRPDSLADNPLELFAVALESNWGGSKPPTREDIYHTIIRMKECGASERAITERLSFLPKSSLRAYMASARTNIIKRKVAKALDDIAEGSTVDEAASKRGVKADTLKDVMAGRKRKWNKGRSDEAEFCIALKSYISSELRSANSGISKKVELLLKRVDDGEVSYKFAEEVIRAWREHLRKTGVRVSDWQARLNALAGETEKEAEVVQ
jgi:hypothetical protein